MDDKLKPARGVVWGTLLSLWMWVMLAIAIAAVVAWLT